MGFLDKLKGFAKRGKPTEKAPVKEAPPKIKLDMAELGRWSDQLVKHFELNRRFDDFSGKTEALRKETLSTLNKFTDEGILSSIPERARTVNTLHGNEYSTQARKLLKKARFTDLFEFEKEHAEFLEANEVFKVQTRKNVSVLSEFMHGELKKTQELLQQIEDGIIRFMGLLEEKKFHHIQQIQSAYERMEELNLQREKYKELVDSLQADIERTQKRKEKIEGVIEEQKKLIRNEESLEALKTLQKMEEEIERTLHDYQSAGEAASKYYQRYAAEIIPDNNIKVTLSSMAGDPLRTLSDDPDSVIHTFRQAAGQLEQEGRGNIQPLIQRLVNLASSATNDARLVKENIPKQRALKKDILRDVAALSIYDQQQSLMRALREEKKIQSKLDYLAEELSPKKILILEREMKDAAINLGAVIVGKSRQEEVLADDTPEEIEAMEEEIEELEQEVEKEQEPPEEDLKETEPEESLEEIVEEDQEEKPKEEPKTEEEYEEQADKELRAAEEEGDDEVEKSEDFLKKKDGDRK